MGRRGPPPTPTEILTLHGSKLVNQCREQTEAKGPAGKPTCPNWLAKDAKKAWKQIVPMLETMHMLSRIDANALARYCETGPLAALPRIPQAQGRGLSAQG